ncbi:nitroreductase family protein [Microbacterium sp. NEAU-LLB]|uniref:Nitroreductase family protein n=1 Tax=Microbacterium stercoris TaxID=2820289 RepID=A0A939QNB5_9MICO|nr:nitroreductase family protein [Microbacterium stercoris]
MRSRRSLSQVTDEAPTHKELVELISAAGRVADHKELKPWRLIELRGDDRLVLGKAIARAQGEDGVNTKPLRAPLLIAVVATIKSTSLPAWEQEATAAGVAHALSLLLDEAGWGVIWRTGDYTRAKAVSKAHGLKKGELLLGWLYVGGRPDRSRPVRGKTIDGERYLSAMPSEDAGDEDAKDAKDAKQARESEKAQKKARKAAKKARKAEKDAEKKARKAEKKARKAEKA